MEINTDILWPFLKFPLRKFLIREVSRIIKTNHTTVRQYLEKYKEEGILLKMKGNPYSLYMANTSSKEYKNLKIYYNLELLRTSRLIEKLERLYDYSPIVLFGSFAKAEDDEKSDVDLCIVSDIQKTVDVSQLEKEIGRKISIHLFTHNAWKKAKQKNPHLINNIINGITLSGQLEVI